MLVPRVAYEMEKTIIRHIAEGKDAVQPLMALTPASVLAGLTAGQREATRTVLENTDRFMAIQGMPGGENHPVPGGDGCPEHPV